MIEKTRDLWVMLGLAMLTLAGWAPAARGADRLEVKVGPQFVIDQAKPGQIRHFPYLSAFGKDLFIAISHHPDAHMANAADGLAISRDGGQTWNEFYQGQPGFHMESPLIKLSDGRLFAMMYPTYFVDERTVKTRYWTSPDMGKSWSFTSGTLRLEQPTRRLGNEGWAGMVFHRSMFQMPDGTLQGTYYGHYADDHFGALWVKSGDGGRTWSVVSTIAEGGPRKGKKYYEGAGEPAIVRCPDGSLRGILRQGSYWPLRQVRSTDNGKTWSPMAPLPGVDPQLTQSVDPDLCLMSNGVLALSFGRPGCHMLFSPDGCGRSWSNPTTTLESRETTGYTGVREVAPGKLLVVGDYHGPARPGDKKRVQQIWGRFVEVKRIPDGQKP